MSPVYGPHRAQQFGACRNRGTALRDKRSPRSARRLALAKAAQAHGSRACACSMRHRPAYRLLCVPPWRALLPHEWTRRRLIGGIWWSSDMIAPQAFIGKPLRVARAAPQAYSVSWVWIGCPSATRLRPEENDRRSSCSGVDPYLPSSGGRTSMLLMLSRRACTASTTSRIR